MENSLLGRQKGSRFELHPAPRGEGAIAILGLGRTGTACAEVLSAQGWVVQVYEKKTEAEIGSRAASLRGRGVQVHGGQDVPTDWENIALVVVSPGLKPDHPVFREATEHQVPVWSEIELAYRLARAPLVAVSGTNGKSTTTALIHQMLQCSGYKAWLCGNVAGTEKDMPLITAAAQASEEEVLVAEVSSFQLEWVEAFRPRVSVLTNLSVDHLDRYGDWTSYARAKSNLFRAQQAEDWAVLNADDEGTRRLLERLADFKLQSQMVWFSKKQVKGDYLQVQIKGELYELGQLKNPALSGQHNQMNALAAATAALLMGAKVSAVQEAIQTFGGIPHRMEFVAELDEVVYINNSMCTNAAALECSLQAVDRPCLAIVGGVEKNREVDRIADAVIRHCAYVLLIGASAGEIAAALRARGFTRYERVDTVDNAVQRARALAAAGSAVILAPGCASFDQFRDFQERGEAFKRAVQQAQHTLR